MTSKHSVSYQTVFSQPSSPLFATIPAPPGSGLLSLSTNRHPTSGLPGTPRFCPNTLYIWQRLQQQESNHHRKLHIWAISLRCRTPAPADQHLVSLHQCLRHTQSRRECREALCAQVRRGYIRRHYRYATPGTRASVPCRGFAQGC
jgi:hypothetical protein